MALPASLTLLHVLGTYSDPFADLRSRWRAAYMGIQFVMGLCPGRDRRPAARPRYHPRFVGMDIARIHLEPDREQNAPLVGRAGRVK